MCSVLFLQTWTLTSKKRRKKTSLRLGIFLHLALSQVIVVQHLTVSSNLKAMFAGFTKTSSISRKPKVVVSELENSFHLGLWKQPALSGENDDSDDEAVCLQRWCRQGKKGGWGDSVKVGNRGERKALGREIGLKMYNGRSFKGTTAGIPLSKHN